MAKLSLRERPYFNSMFLSNLNSIVGESFYSRLFDIYGAVVDFLNLQKTKTVEMPNPDFQKITENMEKYSTALNGIMQNISDGNYDPNINEKLVDVSISFDELLNELKKVNLNLNPNISFSDRFKELKKEIETNYRALQNMGQIKIFTSACKEECKNAFQVIAGNMSVFEKNWQIALDEAKLLVSIANLSIRVVDKNPAGNVTIPQSDLNQINSLIEKLENLK